MRSLLSCLSETVQGVENILLPRGCAGCDLPDALLCPSCSLLLSRYCFPAAPAYFLRIAAVCGTYSHSVRRAILAWKDHDDLRLDRPLGRAISSLAAQLTSELFFTSRSGGRNDLKLGLPSLSLPGAVEQELLIVPAPSSSASLRHRGRVHLVPLALMVADTLSGLGLPARACQALYMDGVGERAVQSVGRLGRARRVSNRIKVGYPDRVKGHLILVLDDIITTGSTIRQCAHALTGAGGTPLTALALAATPEFEP